MVKLSHCCCCMSITTGTIIIAVIDIILGLLSIAAWIGSIAATNAIRGNAVFGSFYGLSIVFCVLVRLPRGLSALLLLIRKHDVSFT